MDAQNDKVNLETLSHSRIHPDNRVDEHARTVPLSILDNTVVNFSVTGAVRYFEQPAKPDGTTDTLKASLQKTVNSYEPWAGQLHWLPYDPANGLRHGRVAITYGTSNDPGVELIVAQCSAPIASLVPDSATRLSAGAWNADELPSGKLAVPTSLAPSHGTNDASLPCVSVQLTTFACGGLSVGLRIAHPVADATALLQFVKDWAAMNRALLSGEPLPALTPTFDPALLDRAAAGNVKSATPDPDILALARSLPSLRYDWWASADGCPAPMLPSTRVPTELAGTDLGTFGDPAPWAEWDITIPVGHHLLYFTPREVHRIWEAASSPSPAPRISRLDALLAFVWTLLARARGMADDPEPLNLAVTLGLRARVAPPLPPSFLGSLLTLARATLPGAQVAASLAAGAAAIRSAMAPYTPAAVSALLHEEAYAVNPQRIWRAFLGRRHSIITSWQNLDVYEVDFGFGAGRPPWYVDATMPSMDGCVHVMEAGPSVTSAEGKRWYDDPVCVSLHLARDVLERLLADVELRKYR